MSQPYAGDLSPEQTYQLLTDDPQAVLVDVRTHAEWSYVGLPDLAGLGKQVITLQWSSYPDGAVDADFVAKLAAAGVSPEQPVAFLCRSGARSASAATVATAAGYGRAYNIADGFEGPTDAAGHRGTTAGWKASGLPWRQP